jgi:hypothetical protein
MWSKDHLDAHWLADGATRRFANDKRGHKALIKWLAASTNGKSSAKIGAACIQRS